jgi:peptide/nickel transport system permease protein/oligopeptide transport system permease protein
MSDAESIVSAEGHPNGTPSGDVVATGEVAIAGSNVATDKPGKPRSLAGDAWRDLRHQPIFWIAAGLVCIFVLMAIWPTLFTSKDPRACDLSNSLEPPSPAHWFGTDVQGCDVYARTIYGARASISVGVCSTLLAGIIATVVGMLAGFFGGWLDSVLSRLTEIVLGIPLLLAAIIASRTFATKENIGIWPVVAVLGVLGWTTAARVIRSSVITARSQDYVQAARMLGASNRRIMTRHILPNALAPMIVVLTIALGAFIATEATLSFLGAGLKPPTISWGIDISSAAGRFQQKPWPLLAPASFLALTVLAFIMLGDAIREAFDPRLR